jgi:hypothetical protein
VAARQPTRGYETRESLPEWKSRRVPRGGSSPAKLQVAAAAIIRLLKTVRISRGWSRSTGDAWAVWRVQSEWLPRVEVDFRNLG